MRHRRWGQTGPLLALMVAMGGGVAAAQEGAVLTTEGRAVHARLYERCRECRVEVAEARRAAGHPETRPPMPYTDVGRESFVGVAVVAGVVEAIEAVPIAEGAGVFTAYQLRVTAVIKPSALADIAPGELLTVTRPGGVLAREGRRVDVAVPGLRAMARGATIRVVLLPAPGTGGFQEQRLPEALVLGGGGR